MRLKRQRIVIAVGTGISAMCIGFFTHLGTADGRPAPTPPRSVVAQSPIAVPTAPAPLSITDIALTSATPDTLDKPLATVKPTKLAQASGVTDALPSTPADPNTPRLACDVDAAAETRAGAMVALNVSAPCFANDRVMIHHNGMMFTDVLGQNGTLDLMVPALVENAVFIVQFQGGQAAIAMAEVPSVVFYDRVAVQWTGQAGFELHAREFGAGYGEDGHVWAGAARDVSSAAMGDAGFLSVLGRSDTHEPHIAQVYSFPEQAASRSGTISVSVEAEITQANCGRNVGAQTFHVHRGELKTRDLSMTIPGCDATGDFLVLNNLIEDLKIAAK